MENNTSESMVTEDRLKSLIRLFYLDKKLVFIVSGLIMLLILFFLSMIFFFPKKPSQTSTVTLPDEVRLPKLSVTQPTLQQRLPATISLIPKGNKRSYHVNDDIVFALQADTNGQAVRGYDGVFKFDKNLVSYISVKDLFPKLSYDVRIRGNWFIATAQQPLNSAERITLQNKNLLEIHFKAVKPGIAFFPLSFVSGRLSDSNLINADSMDILTGVSGTSVRIAQ